MGEAIIKVKDCPLCKAAPSLHERATSAACFNEACGLYGQWIEIEKWNERPVEDALLRDLDVAQEDIDTLRAEALAWHRMAAKLQKAIDWALSRLRQRRLFLNACLPVNAETELARAEIRLIKAMPENYTPGGELS